jgi:hypothetical protein
MIRLGNEHRQECFWQRECALGRLEWGTKGTTANWGFLLVLQIRFVYLPIAEWQDASFTQWTATLSTHAPGTARAMHHTQR